MVKPPLFLSLMLSNSCLWLCIIHVHQFMSNTSKENIQFHLFVGLFFFFYFTVFSFYPEKSACIWLWTTFLQVKNTGEMISIYLLESIYILESIYLGRESTKIRINLFLLS